MCKECQSNSGEMLQGNFSKMYSEKGYDFRTTNPTYSSYQSLNSNQRSY